MKKHILSILTVVAALCLGACSTNSPFVAASEAKPGDGKVPVQVVASVDATGNTANSSDVAYAAGTKIIFGAGVPQSARVAFLKRLGLPAEAGQ